MGLSRALLYQWPKIMAKNDSKFQNSKWVGLAMAKNCPKRKIILGLWPMIYHQLIIGVMFFHQLLAATLGVHFG